MPKSARIKWSLASLFCLLTCVAAFAAYLTGNLVITGKTLLVASIIGPVTLLSCLAVFLRISEELRRR